MNPVHIVANANTNWSVENLLANGTTLAQTIGGALLGLLGTILIVWVGVLLFRKFISNEDQGPNKVGWGKIVMALIVGGLLLFGGYSIIRDVGGGLQTTITDMG